MNCHTYETAIGDYVDGVIDPDAANSLDAHLAACAECRALADDLRAIRAAARRLERHEPPARAWQRIATAVEDDRRRRSVGWRSWRPIAAAAAVLLTLTGAWLVLDTAEPPASAPIAQSPAQPLPEEPDSQDTNAQLQLAIDGLERITVVDAGELDDDTAQILKTNLTLIDAAIGESRAALETEPSSDAAQRSLFAALNTKVTVLHDTVALINEMRNGEEIQQ
jgi:predicted anti-sigma-YlaC factor YlaD